VSIPWFKKLYEGYLSWCNELKESADPEGGGGERPHTEVCWNKMCLTLVTTLSFDDNKILKSQLDMLIFVLVYKTID